MVLEANGIWITQTELRERVGCGLKPVSMGQIVRCLRQFGVAAQACEVAFEDLHSRGGLLILHTHPAHYVVCDGVQGGCARISDPSSGQYWLSEDMARTLLSGYAVLVTRRRMPVGRTRLHTCAKTLQPIISASRGCTGEAVALSTLLVAVLLGVALCPFQFVISTGDWFTLRSDGKVVACSIAIIALALVRRLSLLDMKLRKAWRESLVAEVMESLRKRWPLRRPGDVPERFVGLFNDADPVVSLRAAIPANLVCFTTTLITFILFVLLGKVSAFAAAVSILGLGVLVSAYRVESLRAENRQSALTKLVDDALRDLADSAFVRRTGGDISTAIVRWRQGVLLSSASLGNSHAIRKTASASLESCVSFASAIAVSALVRTAGAVGENSNALQAIVGLSSAVSLAPPVAWFTGAALSWADRIDLLRDFLSSSWQTEPKEESEHRLRVNFALHPCVSATGANRESVPVVYGPEENLDSVVWLPGRLHIEDGARVVIRGTNGSGKSRLLSLLAGLDSTERQAVLIEGKPLPSYSDEERGTLIRYLPQRSRISNSTVVGALQAGNERVPIAHIQQITIALGLHDRLRRLTLGHQTALVNDAEILSASERQLLLVANALAAGSRITLLDDPFQNLDSASMKVCLTTCQRFSRTLVIADGGQNHIEWNGFVEIRVEKLMDLL